MFLYKIVSIYKGLKPFDEWPSFVFGMTEKTALDQVDIVSDDNGQELPDHKKLSPFLSPKRVVKRSLHYYRQLDEYKFFPKFMAAKGGLTAVAVGIFMLPAVAVSGVTVTAIGLGASAVGLIAFGVYGAGVYGGRMLRDAKRTIDWKLFGKAPPVKTNVVTPKPKRKRTSLSPWSRIEKTRVWQKFRETPFAHTIYNTKAFQSVKNMSLWTRVSEVSRDQEVLLRAFATGGSIATVVVTGGILMTQAIALPAIGLSLATAFTAYMAANLVGGAWALVSHSAQLVKTSLSTFRQSAPTKTGATPEPQSPQPTPEQSRDSTPFDQKQAAKPFTQTAEKTPSNAGATDVKPAIVGKSAANNPETNNPAAQKKKATPTNTPPK